MDSSEKPAKASKGWRFWAVFPALCITTLLAAVEATVVSTALPYITHELGAGDTYVWVVNAYLLTSTAFLPILGQMCNVFGRRYMMLLVVALFALGSGVSGGATTMAMLIGGRAVQGIGGGGINLVIELVISDLVPLRERGNYMGLIFLFFTIGTAMGPFIGGAIVERASWRWVFYLNLPIAGAALVLHVLFLRVQYSKEMSIGQKLRRLDYVGNMILIAAVVAVQIGLSWGGTRYSWRAYQVLVPLVLGLVGVVLFHVYEMAPWVKEPTLPERVFRRRTPAAALLISFLHFMLLFWIVYFLPVYFQAVHGFSPIQSGVDFLPTSILSVITGAIAGAVLTKTGKYRGLHFASFVLIAVGMGLFARFDRWTSTPEWVLVQFIPAIGLGLLTTSTLPAVQADLPESDTATATAAFAFMRAYGAIWGVSIPAALFNAKFNDEAWRIGDARVRGTLEGGNAYSFVTGSVLSSLNATAEVEAQVVDVYTRSLKLTWLVSLAFSLLGLLLVFVEKHVELRTTLETEYGLDDGHEKARKTGDAEGGTPEEGTSG